MASRGISHVTVEILNFDLVQTSANLWLQIPVGYLGIWNLSRLVLTESGHQVVTANSIIVNLFVIQVVTVNSIIVPFIYRNLQALQSLIWYSHIKNYRVMTSNLPHPRQVCEFNIWPSTDWNWTFEPPPPIPLIQRTPPPPPPTMTEIWITNYPVQ